MKQFMTIPKLAHEMRVSGNTIRRYLTNYAEFFIPHQIDGWEQYDSELALPVLRRINEVSAAGKRRAEVLRELETKFQRREINSPVEYKTPDDAVPITNIVEFGPKSAALITELIAAVRKMTG